MEKNITTGYAFIEITRSCCGEFNEEARSAVQRIENALIA
jgi:hypothetical protein